MGASGTSAKDVSIVILGAGYAGLRVAREVARRSRGRVRPLVIDRHPVHVLRTQLYEVDRLAREQTDNARWLVPLSEALDPRYVATREGEVASIDLEARSLLVGGERVTYRQLAICLGSVPAYFGVPGADRAHQVYGFMGARRLASELRVLLEGDVGAVRSHPVRVAVVGGGSTGTELAAEIATARWERIVGGPARTPEVTLVTGSLPFLSGFPEPLIRHARRLLERAHVRTLEHLNVTRVEPTEITLENGDRLACDVAVWCAGVQAPNVVRSLAAPHGHGGRVRVDAHLEIPGHPGAFAIGDSAEFQDPTTGMIAPATAQAALAEAPVAAANLLARARARPLVPFRYREKGVIIAVGVGRGAARAAGITLWGSPAALLKAAVDRGYAYAAEHRATPRGL